MSTPKDPDAHPVGRHVWIVTPHASSEFDYWIAPGETEEQDGEALDYAQSRMEEMWDQAEAGTEFAVKMERRLVEPGEDEYETAFGEIGDW